MIQRMSHAPIFVLDQDRALDFYVNKLGFELRDDVKMDNGFRWLTVGAKGQPDLNIILADTNPGHMFDAETSAKLRALIEEGKMGAGAFSTADCRKTYEEMSTKGVKFKSEPKEEFYGIEATFEDDSGNWFSMTQPK